MVGVSEDKLAAIKRWAVSDKFSDVERAVMQATDEIVGRNLVEDETFAALKSHLSDEQIMELFYVIGLWRMHGMIVRALHLEYRRRYDGAHDGSAGAARGDAGSGSGSVVAAEGVRLAMKLYDELAGLVAAFSPPAEYAEEAAFFARVLTDACKPAPRTVLELGSGGGNNAFHLKSKFEMTLVDLSPQMLAVSRALNPDCEHREGDMRTVSLGRTFDAVFVHDAIMYMTSEADLIAAMRNAYRHCRAGGVALFVPDCVRETFVGETRHGGHDGEDGRSLRYLEWTIDPDPVDTTYRTDFAIVLREIRAATRASCTTATSRDCFRAPSGCACCVKPDSSRAY